MVDNRKDMPLKHYTVTQAHYFDASEEMIKIKGVPETPHNYFGEYYAKFPSIGASKAFTGLQKFMKKYRNTNGHTWFPGYDPEDPPDILYTIMETASKDTFSYYGRRVPSTQGTRAITNKDTGRTRIYRWVNDITRVNEEDIY